MSEAASAAIPASEASEPEVQSTAQGMDSKLLAGDLLGAPVEEAVEAAREPVPERYEFKLPEGVQLDTAALDQFTPILKDVGLSNGQAQKLVDAYSALRQSEAARMEADLTAQVNGWKQSVFADKEIGGREFQANVSLARNALARFGTPELTNFLNVTGMANHPELVRVFARIGKSIAPDSFVRDKPSSTAVRPIEERLYGNRT